jgi:sortase B
MAGSIIRLIDRIIDLALVLVCLLMMFIGTYSVLDNAYLYQHASDKSLLYYKPELDIPLAPEKKITDKQAGWIALDGTNIDYPLMQGEDNFEFLNIDPYGDFSLSGSIFLDAGNAKDFSDEYSLVYGHHMEYGKMFGSLEEYLSKDYYEAHKTGTLTSESQVFDYRLFAVTKGDGMDPVLFNVKKTSKSKVLAYLQDNALIYEEPEADLPLLALSTCYGEGMNDRLLVIGTITLKTEDTGSNEKQDN